MNEFFESRLNINRRHFLGKIGLGLGSVALGSLLVPDPRADDRDGFR